VLLNVALISSWMASFLGWWISIRESGVP
jgi:hypothetical protein